MARKYTKELLQDAVDHASTIAGVLRHMGVVQAGGNHAHISRTIKRFGIDTTHFKGQAWGKGRTLGPRREPEHWLRLLPEGSPRTHGERLRTALIRTGRRYVCVVCGNHGVWMLTQITLHVDHIDGNYLNCRPENLRFLCPNCHSQTPTHAGRNKRRKVQPLAQAELRLDETPV